MTVDTRRTACPLDCPDSCSLEARVDAGRLLALEGTRDNPFTAGFICSKVRRFARHLYHDERVRHPMHRRGAKGSGDFEQLSWDAALDLVAERLRTTRGERILPLSYGGSNGLLTQDTLDARLFRRLGASRLARTVCAAPSGAALRGLYGGMPGVALEDYELASLIVVWGCNPSVTGIHLVPRIRAARARGARLVVVDPRSTPLARQADLHLQPRPGSDLAIALALHRWLFDHGRADGDFLQRHCRGSDVLRQRAEPWTLERAAETSGVPTATLDAFARLYADSSPAVIRCGWGVERNRNGGSAVAAILALPAVAGKFGVRGGGYTMSNSRAFPVADVAGAAEPDTRVINMNRVGEALETADPPIELLFVYNCNPLATLPAQERVRRGLAREDLFTVVFEQVWTDTAAWADLVLPATTFLEHDDLARGYGAMVLHRVQPVVSPIGEARSNLEVFGALLELTGLARAGEVQDAERLAEGLVANGPPAAGEVRAPAAGARPILFVDLFPGTPDGKVDLVPDRLELEAPSGLYGFLDDPATAVHPLALISPATARTVSSTFGQLETGPARVELHPDDAAARGLDERTAERLVRVFNGWGEVHCHWRADPGLRPGVAVLPKGLWARHTANGATANALAPDALSDLGGGACFNDARVEVTLLHE